MVEKIQISWEDFGKVLKELKQKIINSGKKYKYVYGIPRGGVIIALYLSHKLNLKYLTLQHDYLDDYNIEEVLIVDDIADTGETLKEFMNFDIATIYRTPWSKINPTYSVWNKTNKDTWIIFPWENLETEDSKDETTTR